MINLIQIGRNLNILRKKIKMGSKVIKKIKEQYDWIIEKFSKHRYKINIFLISFILLILDISYSGWEFVIDRFNEHPIIYSLIYLFIFFAFLFLVDSINKFFKNKVRFSDYLWDKYHSILKGMIIFFKIICLIIAWYLLTLLSELIVSGGPFA